MFVFWLTRASICLRNVCFSANMRPSIRGSYLALRIDDDGDDGDDHHEPLNWDLAGKVAEFPFVA